MENWASYVVMGMLIGFFMGVMVYKTIIEQRISPTYYQVYRGEGGKIEGIYEIPVS